MSQKHHSVSHSPSIGGALVKLALTLAVAVAKKKVMDHLDAKSQERAKQAQENSKLRPNHA